MIEQYLDSKELKRLLSTLVVVVGCLIIAGLFGILIIPGLRNANKPATPTAVFPVTGETGWLNPAEFPVQKGRVIPPVDPGTLIRSSEELKARGKLLYDENCGTCHGPLGKGDGQAAGTMDPAPRDFTALQGWINGRDMAGIFKTLEQGIPDSSMASFDYFTKKDRMALVHYVQALGGYENTEGSPVAMQALSEELASPGEKTNNKIPVSMAMARLEDEFSAPGPITVAGEDHSPAAMILKRTITNGSRASQVLHASAIWRSGPDALARSVLFDAPGNGFSITAVSLTKDEWQMLYDELMKRIRAN